MPHILVIDDDESFRHMVRDTLIDLGHTVAEAADGGKGLALYREQAFDLVFTDILMPDKEGVETIQLLRAINPAVKIVAMSGGGQIGPDDYLHMAKLLGARHCMEKPFRMDDIRHALAVTLGD
ncbi:MAG: response regulator [Verrucomicrobiota bacterium]